MNSDNISNISDFLYHCASIYGERTLFLFDTDKERCTLTYSMFLEATEKCALFYEEKGYSGKKKIALLGENSYEWILNFFAIELSGNIAVLFDKNEKTGRLKNLAERIDIDSIVCSDDYKEEANTISEGKNIKCLSFKEMADGNPNSIYKRREILKDEEAVIAFTSGTTGEAKGVILTHNAIVSNTIAGSKVFKCSGKTVLLLPLNHMYGLNTCLFGSMLFGNTIYINSSLRYIARDIVAIRPDYLLLVPMMMRSILKVLTEMKTNNMPLPEKIASGGAPLETDLIDNYNKLGIAIYNAYGITECAPGIAISATPVTGDNFCMKCVCEIIIDHPDEKGHGEILVRGSNLMNGYYGMKKESDEALSGGWFHTGDIGYLKDDNITVSGRLKNLIVLPNGENIAPEELEKDLKTLPDIEEVIVKQVDSDLVAEIYPKDIRNFDAEKEHELKNSVLKSMIKYPAYKRVNRIEIRNLPFEKTATLKIKRK